jgi:hypothetical protein
VTGFESKRALSASRYADSETIEHIIDLRRENEMLKFTIRDILDFYDATNDRQLLNIQTIVNLRKAIHGATK